MVKRTTISVPDELYEKMEKWRSEINFSKEFQKHIANVIQRKEDLEKMFSNNLKMQKTVERLREEKMSLQPDFFEEGMELGTNWAMDANYEQLQEVLKWDPGSGDIPRGETLDELVEYFYNTLQENEFLDYDAWFRGGHNENNYKFMKGWKAGVDTFWEKVKDKL